MGERGTGRLWSWAQYTGTARRISFPRLTIRHSSFNSGSKARSTTLTVPKTPVGEQDIPTHSPANETKLMPIDSLDPYSYTSGRWLNQDKLECESRYIQFDFTALCKKAVELCPGASNVVQYEKKDGGFNRSFAITMDDGTRVVARLPTRIAGPRRLSTNSEVATMTYLRSHTKLPVPRILDWSDDSSNPIGAEYIIMEHVAGVRLHERWSTMNIIQRMLCVKALSMMVRELAAMAFPGYGSLYFSHAPIDPHSKLDFVDDFCLGPHCGATYWNCNTDEVGVHSNENHNSGPWLDLASYCSGLIDAGLARIPKSDVQADERLPYQGTIAEHIRLLSITREVIERLIENPSLQDAASPTLLHADLHKRNIYVSDDNPTIITGLIDWQSTSVEPAFVYTSETPDFASHPDHVLQPDDGGMNLAGARERSAEQRHTDALICTQTLEVFTKGAIPKLRAATALDETLLKPFRYCHSSWKDSAAAVRQNLIEVSQKWKSLGLPGTCPYLPTEEELAEHKRQYEDFETVQKLKLCLIQTLNTTGDGWIPADAWEWSKTAHKEAFETWMQVIRNAEGTCDEEISVEKARRMWPFDER